MRNGRFPPACLPAEPEDTWCGGIWVIDPVNDLIQDLNLGAIETLGLVQPLPWKPDNVFPDLLDLMDIIVYIENYPISKPLHQLVQLRTAIGNCGGCLGKDIFSESTPS